MKEKLKHAFAIGKSNPFSPNKKEEAVVEKVCNEIVKRHVTLPAIVMLETFRPLNYLGSQLMHFFHPIISSKEPSSPWATPIILSPFSRDLLLYAGPHGITE